MFSKYSLRLDYRLFQNAAIMFIVESLLFLGDFVLISYLRQRAVDKAGHTTVTLITWAWFVQYRIVLSSQLLFLSL